MGEFAKSHRLCVRGLLTKIKGTMLKNRKNFFILITREKTNLLGELLFLKERENDSS